MLIARHAPPPRPLPPPPRRRRRRHPSVAALPPASPCPLGLLTTRPIAPADAGAASVLLARSFAGRAALADAAAFIDDAAAAGGGGGDVPLLLVAELEPDDPSLLPPSKPARLAGVVALALTDAARAAACPDPPLPPAGAPLLFSLAVDPRCRRAGVATRLLAHAEAAVVEAGGTALWLVADGKNEGVAELYKRAGYTPDGDGGGGGGLLAGLLARRRGGAGVLMRKELRAG